MLRISSSLPVGSFRGSSTLTQAEVKVESEGFHSNTDYNAAGKMHFNFTFGKINIDPAHFHCYPKCTPALKGILTLGLKPPIFAIGKNVANAVSQDIF